MSAGSVRSSSLDGRIEKRHRNKNKQRARQSETREQRGVETKVGYTEIVLVDFDAE